jgi:ribosomal protein L40E
MNYQTSNVYTKLCPFCAEQIPVQAVKCRYCGELFTPERLKLVERALAAESQGTGEQTLLVTSPSLWALVNSFTTGFIALCAAIFLLIVPIEKPFGSSKSSDGTVSQSNSSSINIAANQNPLQQQAGSGGFQSSMRKFRILLGLLIVLITLLWLATKIYVLRMTRYEITPQRIEYSRGLFDRKVDNLDMFRIIDMKMRRTPLDCMTGVGTVIVYTTDKTDPEFRFEKVHNPGQLYDIVKKYSLDADRGGSVVHIE